MSEELESTLNETSIPRGLSQIFPRDPVLWLMMAAFAIVTYVFYNTEFRDTLEDWFFDVRMRWAPEVAIKDDVLVVAIDDRAIEVLDSDRVRTHYDLRKRPYLSSASLTMITSILANSDASAIGLLVPDHAFPHADPALKEVTEIARFDQRIFIGTTEYNRLVPSVIHIPSPLSEVRSRVFGYETFRKRSNVVVRSLPYVSYRGLSEDLMLPVRLASSATGTYGDLNGNYMINQLRPERFHTISAAEFRTNPKRIFDAVHGKIVIVGYTISRDVPFQTTDMMSVNTPLVGDEQTAEQGEPLTYLVANAVENLLHDRTLQPADSVFNFIQTIVIASLCGLLWELGSLTASIITALLWFTLIYAHGIAFSWLNTVIPLADTFLASSLVAVFASVRRLKSEIQSMAEKQADADAKGEIARLQSHFLDEFASWLKTMTALIINNIQQSKDHLLTTSPQSSDLYRRAFAAGEDFGEYLESIRQIPALENLTRGRLQKERIPLRDFIDRIVRRFEIKLQDRGMKIEIQIAPNTTHIKTNVNLLDSIIFNFLSNAVKYAPKDSTITIHCRRTRDRSIAISVADQGMGIPKELQERIFEKFYRIQDDRLYGAKGTGLGLYLCRYFAERMGGRVDVRSEPGKGAEFRVVLP